MKAQVTLQKELKDEKGAFDGDRLELGLLCSNIQKDID